MVTEHFVLQYLQGKEVETWYCFVITLITLFMDFKRESITVVLGFLLTCTHEHGNSPTNDLLSRVDGCLAVSYSRAGHSPEALTYSLELLNVIRHVIISAPGRVMHILQALCSSLCLWIEDHAEVMSNDEFNSVV